MVDGSFWVLRRARPIAAYSSLPSAVGSVHWSSGMSSSDSPHCSAAADHTDPLPSSEIASFLVYGQLCVANMVSVAAFCLVPPSSVSLSAITTSVQWVPLPLLPPSGFELPGGGWSGAGFLLCCQGGCYNGFDDLL